MGDDALSRMVGMVIWKGASLGGRLGRGSHVFLGFFQTRQNVGASRKGAPLLLEGAADGDAKWVAVPDIWRTAAVKFGERVALVDPHRHPPAEMTFNQVLILQIYADVNVLLE
jgi:hypothetical protein